MSFLAPCAALIRSASLHEKTLWSDETSLTFGRAMPLILRYSKKERVGSLIVCHRPTPDSGFSVLMGIADPVTAIRLFLLKSTWCFIHVCQSLVYWISSSNRKSG